MFIRRKLIRFGHKNWVIGSDFGYPFRLIPYHGKSDDKKDESLGPKIVKELLEVVADARTLDVYFGNFFTSLPLLEELKNMASPATGTIRSNRAPDLSSPSDA